VATHHKGGTNVVKNLALAKIPATLLDQVAALPRTDIGEYITQYGSHCPLAAAMVLSGYNTSLGKVCNNTQAAAWLAGVSNETWQEAVNLSLDVRDEDGMLIPSPNRTSLDAIYAMVEVKTLLPHVEHLTRAFDGDRKNFDLNSYREQHSA
jgi:hypothetical protein